MKTETTLRMARNSLLCFFMALAAGFLVACGGGGGGDVATPLPGGVSTFPAYLVDAPVEGAEYSGPTRPVKDVTGKNGEFEASEGVFEFSVGATTLGSVRLSSSSAVTPADFIGVDEARAIEIARILQALDQDGVPENGISISQSAREGLTVDLFTRLTAAAAIPVNLDGVNLTIPPADDAEAHFVATRRCLFSGGYAGSYRATSVSYSGPPDEGQLYYVLEPFANRARGVEFSNVYLDENDSDLESFAITVGAIGSTITFSPGNEWSFVTPRLVTGIYAESNVFESESGTYRLTLVAGNPGSNRRIVGVDVDGEEAIGLYVLDYFDPDNDGSGGFSGQYYDVETGRSSIMLLTIAGGGSWPDANTPTTLTLSGTLGGDATAVTVRVIRVDGNYGTFTGAVDGNELSGTWCDIGGASGVAVLPSRAPAPSASAQSDTAIEVTWNEVSGATSYKLYRSESGDGTYARVGGDISALRYLDGGLSASTEYFYRLEACNSGGCSERSPQVSATTQPPPVDDGQCRVGQRLVAGESCEWGGYTFSVESDGSGSYAFTNAGAGIHIRDSTFNGVRITFVAVRSGNVWEIQDLGTDSPAVAPATQPPATQPPADGDECRVGQILTAGESCEWKGYTFSVRSSGRGSYAFFTAGDAITARDTTINGVVITFVAERNGNVWEIQDLGTDPAGSGGGDDNDGDGNGGDGNDDGTPPDDMDDGQCRMGQVLMAGESCEYKNSGLHFRTRSDGFVEFGTGIFLSAGRIDNSGSTINGVTVTTFVATRSGTTWTITELE